jgi:hypothetical protein
VGEGARGGAATHTHLSSYVATKSCKDDFSLILPFLHGYTQT